MSDQPISCVSSNPNPLPDDAIGEEENVLKKKEEDMMAAKVGGQAPDFQATAFVDGGFKDVKLSDYKGQWTVLCFYPGDFTFVWPTELSAVAERKDDFEKLGVQVLAASTDSHFTHKIWQEVELTKMIDGGFPFPMLSDSNGNMGRLYGVFDENGGVDIRGRFIIDPDGVIQAMEVMTPPVGRNVDELIRQVEAYQHVRETGEVTPAGWTKGKKTLKPGPDLAGNVWKVWNPKDR